MSMSAIHSFANGVAAAKDAFVSAAPSGGGSLRDFALEVGLQIQASTIGDSVLHGAQDASVPHSPSAALLSGGMVVAVGLGRKPNEETEKAAMAKLNGELKTSNGGSLAPLHDILAQRGPDQTWTNRQAKAGQSFPATMLMRGTPMLLKGSEASHEQLVLALAEQATGQRFDSIGDMHQAMRANEKGVLEPDFAARLRFSFGEYSCIDGPPMFDAWRREPGVNRPQPPAQMDQLQMGGYSFKLGGHYVTVDPREDVGGNRYLAVQLHRNARATETNIRPGMIAGNRGPDGRSPAKAFMVVSIDGTPAAKPAGGVRESFNEPPRQV
jgi:hypothetical protein